MAVETYVVSVYRRGGERGKEATGMVERTDNGESKAFASSQELWAFLCGKPRSLREEGDAQARQPVTSRSRRAGPIGFRATSQYWPSAESPRASGGFSFRGGRL